MPDCKIIWTVNIFYFSKKNIEYVLFSVWLLEIVRVAPLVAKGTLLRNTDAGGYLMMFHSDEDI